MNSLNNEEVKGEISLFNSIDHQDIGILVRSELSIGEMEASQFVRAACFQQGLPLPQMSIKWRNPNQHPEGNMLFYWCHYTGLHPKNYRLILLRVPNASRGDFQSSELQFPLRLAGCVLIVNLHSVFTLKALIANRGEWPSMEKRFEFQKIWAGDMPRPKDLPSDEWISTMFKKNLNNEWKGVIPKIRLDKLPFVVVPVEPTTPEFPLPAISLEEMSDLLDLEPHISIISCPLEYSLEDVKNLNFPFHPEDIERVLSALVKQIEVGSS